MKLLLKREQTVGNTGGVKFRLWAKIELTEDEKGIVNRYRFEQAVLMGHRDIKLLRRSAIYGFLLATFVGALFHNIIDVSWLAFAIGISIGSSFSYWYYNEKREIIVVRDLLHGRHFACPSIIDLTKKEAEISNITAIFRQIMESAKHWGGTETQEVPVLSLQDARDLILKVY